MRIPGANDDSGAGPKRALGISGFGVWIFLGAYLLFHGWHLPVLTDWVSAAVDEGYTSYAANLIREQRWPYRDFFYVWTPGNPLLHALVQSLGAGWLWERAIAMAASAGSVWLALDFARAWNFSRASLIWLGFLLMVWGFSLWNIPYSSWNAVFLAMLGIRFLSINFFVAAVCFGTAFWFKQNIGIFSFLGAACALLATGKRSGASIVSVIFFSLVLLPFGGIYFWGGEIAAAQAFRQIFLFPLSYPSLMGALPAATILAAPLTVLGLWILSLFFSRTKTSPRTLLLVQAGVVAYVFVHWGKAPSDFIFGGFCLLSILVWPLSLLLCLVIPATLPWPRFLLFWLPGLGVFLQVFPRLDFQHLLFVFPLVALLLVDSFRRLQVRYPWVANPWGWFPLLLLALGGAALTADVVHVRLAGRPDALGRISSGPGWRLDQEVQDVGNFLRSRGLTPGDPILVLPNGTAIYRWLNFKNPTPHLQFFPGYVEAFGARQDAVLSQFEAAGGRFLVVQERSGLAENVPEIFREILINYKEVRAFPEHLTVWEKKQP